MITFLGLVFLLLPAQAETLLTYSEHINKSLPEVYDHATKLLRTRVVNNALTFDFIVDATKEEFALAFPKVRSQVMRTICRETREGTALKKYQANILYRYESVKGQELGEFMVKPSHCRK